MSTNSSQSQSIVDFMGVLTESKRIINAHSRHFLALSVLFLLPLSFSLSVFPTLLHSFTSSSPSRIVSLLRYNLNSSPILLHPILHHHHLLLSHKTLIFSLLFSSFIISLFLLALASITSSVFHGFYGRPVKLGSAITSGFCSFFPLLITFLGSRIVVLFIISVFGGFGYLGVKLIEGIEVGFSYNSFYFYGVCSIGAVLLALALGYVVVNWVLIFVIVVIESKWGFRPMVRSRNLVRGMRWVALSLIVFFGFFLFVLLWISMDSSGDSIVLEDGWSTWGFAVRIVATSAVMTLILLHKIAAITVLYMYCKALHGELAGDIAHEFASDYVSLPFDDEKVPHVVCYVH